MGESLKLERGRVPRPAYQEIATMLYMLGTGGARGCTGVHPKIGKGTVSIYLHVANYQAPSEAIAKLRPVANSTAETGTSKCDLRKLHWVS